MRDTQCRWAAWRPRPRGLTAVCWGPTSLWLLWQMSLCISEAGCGLQLVLEARCLWRPLHPGCGLATLVVGGGGGEDEAAHRQQPQPAPGHPGGGERRLGQGKPGKPRCPVPVCCSPPRRLPSALWGWCAPCGSELRSCLRARPLVLSWTEPWWEPVLES